MNYGICSNGSRDTGYETAIRVADIIASLGSVPAFEAGMDEVCPNLNIKLSIPIFDFIWRFIQSSS